MLSKIEEDVPQSEPGFARRAERAGVIALGPDRPSPCEGLIDGTCDAHGQALHAPREALAVARLDDEMNVVRLDRVVDDAERGARGVCQGISNRAEDHLLAQ